MNTSKSIRESGVEKELVARVQGAGGEAYKFTSPGRRGVPDRLVLLPGRAPSSSGSGRGGGVTTQSGPVLQINLHPGVDLSNRADAERMARH